MQTSGVFFEAEFEYFSKIFNIKKYGCQHSDANFDHNLVVADNASAFTHNSSGQVLTHIKEEKQ